MSTTQCDCPFSSAKGILSRFDNNDGGNLIKEALLSGQQITKTHHQADDEALLEVVIDGQQQARPRHDANQVLRRSMMKKQPAESIGMDEDNDEDILSLSLSSDDEENDDEDALDDD